MYNKETNVLYLIKRNIQSLNRNKNTESGSNKMDELTYAYKTNKPNQLKRVDDAVTTATNADDIKDQTTENNYIYNSIGQLIENKDEQVKYAYNASGLVTEVQKNGTPRVRFFYDDRGHRIRKEVYDALGNTFKTYYVRDASGSPMGIYSGAFGPTILQPTVLKEQPIYGSSRLGVHYRQTNSDVYQLTDHLGNVRAVIMKNGENAVSLTAKTDYYPGGMAMPNRNVVGDYRYNYQGQELDKETGKVAFEARLYDPRINRWLTVDPAHEFFSPYMAMGNNWINTIDPDGRCTDCPNNAAVGDTYNHPDYGEVTFGENGWSTADGVGILDDVVLGANEMTPFDVGVEWLTGNGPRHRDFFAGDTFTEMLKNHEHVQNTVDIIGKKLANNDELYGYHNYSLAGVQGVGKYVKDYSTLLTAGQTGNLAVTYLGSYRLNYTISNVDVQRRTVQIHFTVNNSSSIQSATRPPVIGYTDAWKNGPGKWINNSIQTGPMSTTTQTLQWSTTIKY